MAVERKKIENSFKAGGTIGKNVPVKMSAKNTVVAVTANTDNVVGIATMDAVSGNSVPVATVSSVVKLQCASAVTLNDYVGLDSSAPTKIATLTLLGSGTTIRQVVGVALDTGATSDWIPVLILLYTDRT